MKKTAWTILMLSLITSLAFAQAVEHDDMYFNSRDRAKLKEQRVASQQAYASATNNRSGRSKQAENMNPTDSYSARSVNPEFAARSNARAAAEDEQNYFVQDFRYNTASNFNNWNNNFNRWYGNPWVTRGWFAPGINMWNSPFYGYNDPFFSPWYDPFWNYNGWSTGFSFHWGNSWNYGWGGAWNYWNRPYMGMGWGSAWGPSMGWGWGSAWGPSWGWGSTWFGGPRNVIVVNNLAGDQGGRNVTYGKRPTRGTTMMNNPSMMNQNTRTRNVQDYTTTGIRDNTSGGRVSETRRQEEHYNRSWRYSAPGNSGYSNDRGTNNGRTFDSNTNTRTNSWNSPSYNSGGSMGSGGVRPSGGSTGTGSGGRTRGRD
jgi:hypothetical protein